MMVTNKQQSKINKLARRSANNSALSKLELELMLENASKKGAKAALAEIGLHDDHALTDIRDLRELLSAFRMAKKDSFRILIKCIIIGFMTIVTAGFISLLGSNKFK